MLRPTLLCEASFCSTPVEGKYVLSSVLTSSFPRRLWKLCLGLCSHVEGRRTYDAIQKHTHRVLRLVFAACTLLSPFSPCLSPPPQIQLFLILPPFFISVRFYRFVNVQATPVGSDC